MLGFYFNRGLTASFNLQTGELWRWKYFHFWVLSWWQEMPQSGACRFLGHLEQMCKVSTTSGAASAQLQPFDPEIGDFWGFLLLWEQQHSRGSHGTLWFVAAAAFPQPRILSGVTEKWPMEIGKHTLQWFFEHFNSFKPLHYFKCNEEGVDF